MIRWIVSISFSFTLACFKQLFIRRREVWAIPCTRKSLTRAMTGILRWFSLISLYGEPGFSLASDPIWVYLNCCPAKNITFLFERFKSLRRSSSFELVLKFSVGSRSPLRTSAQLVCIPNSYDSFFGVVILTPRLKMSRSRNGLKQKRIARASRYALGNRNLILALIRPSR